MSQGPAIPNFILRGHQAPVHALLFFAENAYLASGDNDGWLIIWAIANLRPVAVMKAHEGGVSGLRIWGSDRLVSHGRDHKLIVWQLPADYSGFSTTAPAEGASTHQKQFWVLHAMDVSALNFCTFSICSDPTSSATEHGLLIANPNGLDSGGIDIFQLPTERRISQLRSDKAVNTGMVMSVALAVHQSTGNLHLLSGYEDGQVAVHILQGTIEASRWQRLALVKAHTQPVLSLRLSPIANCFITSSADAHIVKFSFDLNATTSFDKSLKTTNTKHAGQQGLSIRSDGKIFATAGWDGRVRVYSTKTMKELAVLQWHKVGCYASAFADVSEQEQNIETQVIEGSSALDVIRHERILKAQQTHWLSAGDKDGKISLWKIY